MIITSALIDDGRFSTNASATLDRLSVLFILPDGDDRDADTGVSIQLKKQDGTAIAGDGSVAPGQHMSDPGSYGPYNIPVQTPATLSVYKGGYCEFTIQPSGSDHWIVTVVLLAHFTDGTMVHSTSGIVGLDQDHNAMRFGL